RAAAWQAMEPPMARARGGKDRLAATSGVILEVELATGPTSSPQSGGVGVKIDHRSGLDVGERGGLVQEQDQPGALPQVGRGRASRCESSGLGEELIGEGRAIMRGRPGHETAPGATGLFVSGDDALTLSLPRLLATLQLFAEWTTKAGGADRPLPPRAAGEAVPKLAEPTGVEPTDPCRLVRQVKLFPGYRSNPQRTLPP